MRNAECELARQDLIDKNALTLRLASMEQRAEAAEAEVERLTVVKNVEYRLRVVAETKLVETEKALDTNKASMYAAGLELTAELAALRSSEEA